MFEQFHIYYDQTHLTSSDMILALSDDPNLTIVIDLLIILTIAQSQTHSSNTIWLMDNIDAFIVSLISWIETRSVEYLVIYKFCSNVHWFISLYYSV